MAAEASRAAREVRVTLDGVVDRLHARSPGAVFGAICAVALVNAILATVTGVVSAGQRIDLTGAQIGRLGMLAGTLAATGLAITYVAWRRAFRPVAAWMRAPETTTAPEVWSAVARLALRLVRFEGWCFTVLFLPVPFWVIGEADLPWTTLPFVFVFVEVTIGFALILNYFGIERLMLPTLRELAPRMPPGFTPDFAAPPLRLRIFVVISLVSIFTAFSVSAFQPDDAGVPTQAVVSVGLPVLTTLTLGLLPLRFLAESVVAPIDHLQRAAARIGAGDLGVHAPVLGGDEMGHLTGDFNRMVGGLREREHLAEENASLQARVHEQLEEVRASRARIVAASDAERRRIERNIHDGAQQRLVGLALQLALLKEKEPDDARREALAQAGAQLSEALDELRELARGLHPQVLTVGGLAAALSQLAGRSPVPVTVDATDERFAETIESTAYFVASEALANVAKYSQASRVDVRASTEDGRLVLEVRDDGVGGADATRGSGLAGIADRLAALDGALTVTSPPGAGTVVRATLPLS